MQETGIGNEMSMSSPSVSRTLGEEDTDLSGDSGAGNKPCVNVT